MPWKRPSSQPTSWACAIRSSLSDGVASSVNGSDSRSSSSTSSGASPASSSLIEAWWISLSRVRLASSSGAAFTSSSSWRIMLPIRITLAGCSTRSVSARSPSSSSSPVRVARAGGRGREHARGHGAHRLAVGSDHHDLLLARRLGPVGVLSHAPQPRTRSHTAYGTAGASGGEQDLADVPARLHQRVRVGRLGSSGSVVCTIGRTCPSADQRPHVLDDRAADRRLLLDRPGPQRGARSPRRACAAGRRCRARPWCRPACR